MHKLGPHAGLASAFFTSSRGIGTPYGARLTMDSNRRSFRTSESLAPSRLSTRINRAFNFLANLAVSNLTQRDVLYSPSGDLSDLIDLIDLIDFDLLQVRIELSDSPFPSAI